MYICKYNKYIKYEYLAPCMNPTARTWDMVKLTYPQCLVDLALLDTHVRPTRNCHDLSFFKYQFLNQFLNQIVQDLKKQRNLEMLRNVGGI